MSRRSSSAGGAAGGAGGGAGAVCVDEKVLPRRFARALLHAAYTDTVSIAKRFNGFCLIHPSIQESGLRA